MSGRRAVGVVAVATALAACSGSGSSAGPPGAGTGRPSPPGPVVQPAHGGAPGGTVSGRYREAPSRGALTGRAGVEVGLFSAAFAPGSGGLAGSSGAGGGLITSTRTGDGGRFVLRNVPDGTWFLTRPDGVVPVTGRWVRVDAATGADVDLEGCTTCPPAA